VRDVVRALREHLIDAFVLQDEDVLGPETVVDGVAGVPRPVDAVRRRRVAERFPVAARRVVSCEPEPPGLTLAEDEPALADLAVPGVETRAGEERVALVGHPVDELPREPLRETWGL
jgi:hypothetical protein